jgi:hypothetical protein
VEWLKVQALSSSPSTAKKQKQKQKRMLDESQIKNIYGMIPFIYSCSRCKLIYSDRKQIVTTGGVVRLENRVITA